jgi:hypothetical protein
MKDAISVVKDWINEHDADDTVILEICKRSSILTLITIQNVNIIELQASLGKIRKDWLQTYKCDVNVCPAYFGEWYNSQSPGECLFIFDVDSTLIQLEVIDELARRAGIHDEIAVNYRSTTF